MKQAIMKKPGEITFHEVEKPAVTGKQVLIKIMRIGVCGSDIHVYHGKHPFTPYPVVQGHEVSGEIVETGADAGEFKPGDKVTIRPQVVCGKCYHCRHGDYHICENLKVMGFQTTGMASEYFAVDSDKVYKLPEGVSFDHGAMIEPLAVAVHALGKGGSVKGKKVLVLGAGTIGNLVAQAAKGFAAESVMITEVSDYRLDIAKETGIDYCVNSKTEDLNQQLLEHFGGDRADLILECVGISTTMNQAIHYARKGTDIIVVGVFGDKGSIEMALVQDRELNLKGTLMYKDEDYKKAIELLKDKKINLEPLISNHFKFDNYLDAYHYIDKQKDKSMKVIIDVGEE